MKRKLVLTIAGIATVIALAGCGEQKKYDEAMNLFEQGEYESAKAILNEIIEFEDSAAKIEEIETVQAYLDAISIFESADYEGAIAAFTALGDYENSKEYIKESERFIAIAAANELLNNGSFEEAIAAFNELEMEDMVNEATYMYATKLNEEGSEEAYYQYTKVIDYKDSLSILEEKRNAEMVAAETFTDDYGTEFTINGPSFDVNELGVSLSFFRDDLIKDTGSDYCFSDSMEKEWKKMAKHVKLVLDGTTFYSATTESGIPYCDIKGEVNAEKQWFCWVHFSISKSKFEEYNCASLYYDDIKIYDFDKITTRSAREAERSKVYEKAVKFFNNGEYYLAKEQFNRLFNYEQSDAYLNIINTYFDLLLYEQLGNEEKVLEEKEKLEQLTSENNIEFNF